MARVGITAPADADSTEIIRDLTAKAGELVADRYEADFDALYLRLTFPESGSPRPKLGRLHPHWPCFALCRGYRHMPHDDLVAIIALFMGDAGSPAAP